MKKRALHFSGKKFDYLPVPGIMNICASSHQRSVLTPLCFAFGLSVCTVFGDIHYVSLNGSHTHPFGSSNGVYQLENEIVVSNAITLLSLNGRSTVTVDGNVQDRCFNLNHSGGILDGFSITDGYVKGDDGAGVRCSGGLIRNCHIYGNYADNDFICAGICVILPGSGGGVYLTGNGTLERTLVENNTADFGGGAYLDSGMIVNSKILGNLAMLDAGGVWAAFGTSILNSTIAANECNSSGGGIYFIDFGYVSNSIVYSNTDSGAGPNYYDPLLSQPDIPIAVQRQCLQWGLAILPATPSLLTSRQTIFIYTPHRHVLTLDSTLLP